MVQCVLRVSQTYPWWMETTDAKVLMVRGVYSEYLIFSILRFVGQKKFLIWGEGGGGRGGGCLDLSRNVLGVKTSKQFEDCCSSTLQYRARMRSCSSRIPDKEKLNSNGTINKQPQTFNFLCFFLVILFNPLWGFLRLGNSAREFRGLIFGPEILF